MKVVRWDLLGDPPGENEGTKGVKIGTVSKRKNGPALKKGRTKHTGQCQVLQGTGNLTKEMRNLSGYANW